MALLVRYVVAVPWLYPPDEEVEEDADEEEEAEEEDAEEIPEETDIFFCLPREKSAEDSDDSVSSIVS